MTDPLMVYIGIPLIKVVVILAVLYFMPGGLAGARRSERV